MSPLRGRVSDAGHHKRLILESSDPPGHQVEDAVPRRFSGGGVMKSGLEWIGIEVMLLQPIPWPLEPLLVPCRRQAPQSRHVRDLEDLHL